MRARTVLPCAACLLLGLVAGRLAAFNHTPTLRAREADRAGGSAVATGPVSVRVGQNGAMFTRDAIYYLDYASGRLMAAVPDHRQTAAGSEVLGAFAVRDLVADFRPAPGTTPHFLMSVGRLGENGGWAPLFVFETTTGQVATYRVEPAPASTREASVPRFELIELVELP